jgi:hypothetical protein
MQRWTAFLFVLFVGGAVALVLASTRGAPGARGPDAGAVATSSGAASASAAQPEPTSTGKAAASEAPPSPPSDSPPPPTTDAGATLLSGEAAPSLPGDAPKSVVFGVILVQYRGAQGAPQTARSRDAALALAKQLAVDAKQDFKAAVGKGDKGSTENAGKIQRNFLEPAPEYVLFSLAKDAVSEPVDTPRGFWIVKRVE